MKEKDTLAGFCILRSDGNFFALTVSQNGAIYRVKMDDLDDPGCYILTSEKMVSYVCFLCLSLFSDRNKLREHSQRQHLGPVICEMCGCSEVAILELRKHKLGCSFPCGVVGCNLMHQKRVQAINHKKKSLK